MNERPTRRLSILGMTALTASAGLLATVPEVSEERHPTRRQRALQDGYNDPNSPQRQVMNEAAAKRARRGLKLCREGR